MGVVVCWMRWARDLKVMIPHGYDQRGIKEQGPGHGRKRLLAV